MKTAITTVLMLSLSGILLAQCVETRAHLQLLESPQCSYLTGYEGRLVPGFSHNGSAPFFMRAVENSYKSPSPERNFVRIENYSRTIRVLRLVFPPTVRSTTFQYFNGVGTLVQSIDKAASPTGGDVISFTKHDTFGRSPRNYLPYVLKGDGAFRSSPVVEQKEFYSSTFAVADDSSAFSLVNYDESPLNRVTSSMSYGWRWHSETPLKNEIGVNEDGEVPRFSIDAKGLPNIEGYIPAGALTILKETDEGGLQKLVFKDFTGNPVLEKSGSPGNWLSTRRIFDNRGQLMFVFPPEAMNRLSEYNAMSDKQAFLDKWCFQFRYDRKGRVIEKKVPGAGWLFNIYDSWDRAALSQDANQRERSEWSFTKYDQYNRVIMTGKIKGTREALASAAASATTRFEERSRSSIGYTNRTFPSHSEETLLTISYYDDYNFLTYPSWDKENVILYPENASGIVATSDMLFNVDASVVNLPVVRGYATGKKTKLSDRNGTRWLNRVTYYNRQYQPVQTVVENHLGGKDVTSKNFDEMTGVIRVARRVHTAAGRPSLSVVERFYYDKQNRLLRVLHQVNDSKAILMVENKYNALGQLIEKNLHSEDSISFLQSIDYRYNIQGWLTHINNSKLSNDGKSNDDSNDLFGMEVVFLDSTVVNKGAFVSIPRFDGGVSAIKWKTNTKAAGVSVREQVYAFDYDSHKRFKRSYYAINSGGYWNSNPALYNEDVLYYDANGNIGGSSGVGLTRYGKSNGIRAVVDKLRYRYEGNQLQNVEDQSGQTLGFADLPGSGTVIDEYRYDANGNVVEDMNKSITSITYNDLNLPARVEFTRLSPLRTDEIIYTYDAEGSKLSKEVNLAGKRAWKTDYVSGVRYDNDSLSYFETSEGRVVYDGQGFGYEYFLTDHQSNVRVVCAAFKQTDSYLATMENVLERKETTIYKFENIPGARSAGNNITRASADVVSPNKSARCNGYSDALTAAVPVGPGKRLSVTKGDVVYAEVYARFNEVKTNTKSILPAILGTFVSSAFQITSSENQILYSNITAKAGTAASSLTYSSTVPKAYLVLLFFDAQHNFVRSQAEGISEDAFRSFEQLKLSFTADRSGDVFVYVVNESAVSASVDVFFDDLYVVHQKSQITPQVLQAADYYPYGLTFNEYHKDRLRRVYRDGRPSYEPMIRNRVLFQGQELESDLGLNVYGFKYRMHDAAIGRFGTVDPLAGDYMHLSPYAFSGNNLTNAVELEGLEPKMIYNYMKRISPIAFKIDFSYSSHDFSIGYNISVGLPKSLPFAVRKEFGQSYRSKDILQQGKVVESRSGYETSYLSGLVSFQTTDYHRPGRTDPAGFTHNTSQSTGMITLGMPWANIEYENDWHPEGLRFLADPFDLHKVTSTDKFGTAAMSLNGPGWSAGFKLGTGDPGPFGEYHTRHDLGGKAGTYVPYNQDGALYDPDRYRLGLIYSSFGYWQMGINNDKFRNMIQNVITHDHKSPPSPWFMPTSFYDQLYLGISTGSSTQW